MDYQSESKTKQNNKLISIIQYHSKMVCLKGRTRLYISNINGQGRARYLDGPTTTRAYVLILKDVRGNKF